MATIASLMVNVLADVSDLKTSMAKAESSVSGFASAAKKAFIGIVSVQAIRNVAEYADTIGDLAKKTGTSTDFIQKAGYAAKITGGSMEGLANSVVYLQKGLAGGDKGVVEAMRKLGLSMSALRAMSPEAQFKAVTEALYKVTDSGQQAELSLGALGRTGRENLGAIREGFTELGDQAAATGQIMDAEAVRSLGNFNDALDRTLTVGKSLLGSVLGPFVPMLESLASAVGYVATHFGHLVTAVWKVVDPFTKVREGFKEWSYYLGFIKPVGPAVEAVASSFDLASRAAKPLVMTLEQAAVIEKTLTRELETNRNAMEQAARGADELAQAYLEADQAVVKFVPALSKLDGMLVQTLKGAGDAGTQFEFLKFEIQGVHDSTQQYMDLMPALKGNMTTAWKDGADEAAKRAADMKKTLQGTAQAMVMLSKAAELMGQTTVAAVASIGASVAQGFASGGPIGGWVAGVGSLLTWAAQSQADAHDQWLIDQAEKQARIEAAIKRYGFTILEFVDSVRVDRLSDAYEDLMLTWVAMVEKTNDEVLVLARMASGFEELVEQYHAAGIAAEWMDEWIKKLNSIEVIERRIALLTAELNAAIAARAVMDWEKAEEIISKYGGTLDTLGKQFTAAKNAASWADVWDDWQTLIDMGAEVGGVLFAMKDEIQALVQESLRIGTEIPAQFQPLIAELIRTGQLFDASGDAITDISQLQFGAPLVTEVDKLIAKIDELIRVLTQGLAPALTDLERPLREPWRDWPDPRFTVRLDLGDVPDLPEGMAWEVPSYARGGVGDFGSGTLAMLHGREAIVPLGSGGVSGNEAGGVNGNTGAVVAELRVLQVENAEIRMALESLPRTLARSMRDVVLMTR